MNRSLITKSYTASFNSTVATQQRRICEYLGLACTHNRTFLCLPPAVRLHIYEEADLFSNDVIDLNHRPELDAFSPRPEGPVYSLLLSCRAVYAELSSILYSTNRIFIRYKDSQSLQSLRNLTAPTLAAIRHLTIHLNVTFSDLGEPCSNFNQRNVDQYTKPLRYSSRQHQEIFLEWESAASHVLAHAQQSTLHLHFICDVEDVESAKRVVKPFLSASALAGCNVRLNQSLNPVLLNLAQNTVAYATGDHSNDFNSPFRFLDLPLELRHRILKYTDLITPFSEVEWCPKRGFCIRYASRRCGAEDCPPDLHYACQFRNCRDEFFAGCFCRRHHAAFSSQCHCWVPPTSLFLTCRALRELAKEVFFSGNRFIIVPSGGCDSPAACTPDRLEASLFFTQAVPLSALRFLRFVEIVFPPFEEDYLRADEPAYPDWLQTIKHIKGELNLKVLTLRIYMADLSPYHDYRSASFRSKLTKEQGIAIIKMYIRALQPLSELKGLYRFFVHLAWPFAWTKWARRRLQTDPKFIRGRIMEINRRMEQLVMGREYPSSSLREQQPRISQWLSESIQDQYI